MAPPNATPAPDHPDDEPVVAPGASTGPESDRSKPVPGPSTATGQDGETAASESTRTPTPVTSPDTSAGPATEGSGASRSDDDIDVDEQWARIIAELSELSTLGPAADPPVHRARVRGPRDWPVTAEVEALEEAETHYTPPEPPPVLGRDPLAVIAWSLVVGVPMLLVVLLVFAHPFPVTIGRIGAGLFVAGLAVLLWRMPRNRDDDDSHAVV